MVRIKNYQFQQKLKMLCAKSKQRVHTYCIGSILCTAFFEANETKPKIENEENTQKSNNNNNSKHDSTMIFALDVTSFNTEKTHIRPNGGAFRTCSTPSECQNPSSVKCIERYYQDTLAGLCVFL